MTPHQQLLALMSETLCQEMRKKPVAIKYIFFFFLSFLLGHFNIWKIVNCLTWVLDPNLGCMDLGGRAISSAFRMVILNQNARKMSIFAW